MTGEQNNETIFDRILSGEIPCNKVYEDEHCLAFHDISPQAPVHVLIIPRKRIVNIASTEDGDAELLGRLLLTARTVATQIGLDSKGYRLVFNNGEHGCQSVPHLHCHLLGGRQMGWPPG